MNRINILNTSVDNYSMKETLQFVEESIVLNKYIHHVGVNAEKIAIMQTDLQLREYVNHSDLINPDGIGVIWASKILGNPLKERVAGIDLMIKIVALAHKKNYKVYFLGAKEEVVKSVVDKYTKQYSSNIIAGYRNGYFKKEEEKDIAIEIANSGANILFVAISSPAKENFLYENKKLLEKVNFVMGVGGSFDVVAGKVKRAPLWMQNSGLEWFYRFAQEPRRMWKRYLIGNVKFILLVIKWKLIK